MSLNETPSAQRLHIGIFGKTNSGKSTLFNRILNQDYSMVSSIAGTTADPVRKAMEYHGLGPVVFIDTAGFDEDGELGSMRQIKSRKVVDECDIAILVLSSQQISEELRWLTYLQDKNVPTLVLYNEKGEPMSSTLEKTFETKNVPLLKMNLIEAFDGDVLRQQLISLKPQSQNDATIVSDFVKKDDLVLLIMPQDIQAPAGRLILPQVQTIRDLLDHHCVVVSATVEEMASALKYLTKEPDLIICDSQVFDIVYANKPQNSKLTSFSVLLARFKGDIEYFAESAKMIDHLSKDSKVLIAEACTHAPLSEDIGKVKIPMMLKKRFGPEITIEHVSGKDFPQDLSKYDLIIHCGACMFNKAYVMSRVEAAKKALVPMTNYGIFIAHVKNILPFVIY